MPANGEVSVLGIIKAVLPDGTTRPDHWTTVCDWPPDLFAAVATITERSGLYAEATFVSYWAKGEFELSKKKITSARAIGNAWAVSGNPPKAVADDWSTLVRKYGHVLIDDKADKTRDWKKIVFRLLTIADEACAGIGFSQRAGRSRAVSAVQYLVAHDYVVWQEKRRKSGGQLVTGGEILPYLPNSLCIRVPPLIACVQPKTSTPLVGCTLRSLTNNLALLPPVTNVSTHWQLAHEGHGDLETFNFLIVPFPFHLPGKSFARVDHHFPGSSNERAFTLRPSAWMGETKAEEFATFLLGLIEKAQTELEPVHAIVMPETALQIEFASRVAQILARDSPIDLFITGVVIDDDKSPRNAAGIYSFAKHEIINASFQSKHHRWLLNGSQITRYHLGHLLDPGSKWWEKIDLSYRNCYVTLFRPRAALSVLICEDLARYDPVLTVMNAIGPNLVIALLMDGPQLEQRWPGRYATVLAEDPGSAVLTVTSLGMVLRSNMPGEPENREIALWKEPNGRAQPLKLPKGDHALLVSLTSRLVEQFTLDGRGDGGSTIQFGLGAARGVRSAKPLPPRLEFGA
jgi:hypothetical protein